MHHFCIGDKVLARCDITDNLPTSGHIAQMGMAGYWWVIFDGYPFQVPVSPSQVSHYNPAWLVWLPHKTSSYHQVDADISERELTEYRRVGMLWRTHKRADLEYDEHGRLCLIK